MNYLEQQYWDIKTDTAVNERTYMLFALLQPKVRRLDGQWHVIYQDGAVVGIGDSLYLAVLDFNKRWYEPIRS